MWHADHTERTHVFTTSGLYRNSTDSKNTLYNRLAWNVSGNLLKDSNVFNGVAQPDQTSAIEEYEGKITSSARVFGEPTLTANHAEYLRYVDRTGTFLTPIIAKSEIIVKKKPEAWPEYRSVRADAEFDLATSTLLDQQEPVDFQVDLGELLSNVVILMAAVSSTGPYSKRVIMTLAGIAKPIVKGNTLRVRATVLHTNHPDDGFDSLTYTATVSIRSAFINWYYQPDDKLAQQLEEAVTAQPAQDEVRPTPKRRIFRILRAMLTPSRKIHN